ncbi:MAG TPA: response regulator transcription factor, partial [Candidatus Saccharimonadales bacterium]|nr:response regulator transcription factor [Candidatus Saccharimonadales bacterium]
MRILVIEDEVKIASAIKRGLGLHGHAVDTVHDSDNGFSYAADPDYDVIILDRMLPGSMDGVQLCQKLREQGVHTPVLMLTARGTIGDKVEGLNSGADDYLVKPFSFDELTARVRALLRRPAVTTGTILRVDNLELDPVAFTVTRAGQPVKLSHKEFLVLEYFMHHKDQIITKDTLIAHIWNEDADVLPNTVEVYIGYLRSKIDRPFPDEKPLIHTVRGFGYRLGV